jgi:hypothetical protein
MVPWHSTARCSWCLDCKPVKGTMYPDATNRPPDSLSPAILRVKLSATNVAPMSIYVATVTRKLCLVDAVDIVAEIHSVDK